MTNVNLDAATVAKLMESMGVSAEMTKKAGDILVDIEIGKATHAQSLTAGEHVNDRWDEGQMHRVVTAEQIKVGPAQHASGGGAEKMVREYSHPAPQDGTVTVPMQLEQHLRDWGGYGRSLAASIDSLRKGQEAMQGVLTHILTKAAAEADGADPSEAGQFSQHHAKRAEKALRAMKAALAKHRQLGEKISGLEGTDKDIAKRQLRVLHKAAVRLGVTALASAYAAKSEDADPASAVRTEIHSMLETDPTMKADMSHLHDKDKDKDEEKDFKKKFKKSMKNIATKAAKRAAKKAAAAAPAVVAAPATKGEDKGNQADEQNSENKNQADHAAKSAQELEAAIEAMKKALSGNAILEGKIDTLMDVIRGKPVTNNVGQPLELAKGGPDTLIQISQRIEEGQSSGRLDSAQVLRAKNLLQKVTAVQAGAIDEGTFTEMVKRESTSVQSIFGLAA